jgi:hypothetical protein
MRDANLPVADLSRANLRGANLRRADLRGIYLSGTGLRGADLRDTYFRDTDLSGADADRCHDGLRGTRGGSQEAEDPPPSTVARYGVLAPRQGRSLRSRRGAARRASP